MTSAVQVEVQPEGEVPALPVASGLRQQAAAQLAAHRQRRARQAVVAATAPPATRRARPGAAAAERVAERYARTPSFRAALAEQAQRAMEQAAAEAEVALRNAEAVAAAQQALLAELIQYDMQVPFTPETAVVLGASGIDQAQPGVPAARLMPGSGLEPEPEPVQKRHTGGLTVKLYEDTGRVEAPVSPAQKSAGQSHNLKMVDLCPDEAAALDEEIAFRQAPVFEDYAGLLAAAIAAAQEPPIPLPANLLEFPRQLVASRKARPRLAEGPLREDDARPGANLPGNDLLGDASAQSAQGGTSLLRGTHTLHEAMARSPQLRIFEVDPEQRPAGQEPAGQVSVWSSILLDAHTVTEIVEDPGMPTALLPSLLAPQVAPLMQRLLAVALDATLVLAAFVGFVAAAAEMATSVLRTPAGLGVPAPVPLASFALGTLATFWLLYQGLFFTFASQTPGMRYARIGLCTFTDENPSRSAMRRRILAQMVAACPLGLGLVWVLLDDDRLGWHDRISRMYQRAY